MTGLLDISKRCGVSVSTVSKALNGAPDVGKETTEKVCRAASEMGYSRKTFHRLDHSVSCLGILFSEGSSPLENELLQPVWKSFAEEAESRGYGIAFLTNQFAGKAISLQECCRILSCRGAALAGIRCGDSQVAELAESDFPLVSVGRVWENRISVLPDHIGRMTETIKYLHERGQSQVAFICSGDSEETDEMQKNFHRCCDDCGLEILGGYVKICDVMKADSCRAAVRELLVLREPPTCILFSNDFFASCGILEIEKSGLKIPTDISVLKFGDSCFSRIFPLPITAFCENLEMLGKEAADHLADLIEHPESFVPQQVLVPGKIFEGKTVADLRAQNSRL